MGFGIGKWAMVVWLMVSVAKGADERVLVGRSGVHTDAPKVHEEKDAVAARQAAQQAAEADLVRQINSLAKQLTGRTLLPRACWREYQWLVRQPGVRKDFRRWQEVKDYGTVVTAEYSLVIPDAVLSNWHSRLEQAHRSWLRRCLVVGLGTVGGWLVGFLLLALLDRWTLGYRRGLLAGLGLVLGLALTGSVWLWVLTAYY